MVGCAVQEMEGRVTSGFLYSFWRRYLQSTQNAHHQGVTVSLITDVFSAATIEASRGWSSASAALQALVFSTESSLLVYLSASRVALHAVQGKSGCARGLARNSQVGVYFRAGYQPKHEKRRVFF